MSDQALLTEMPQPERVTAGIIESLLAKKYCASQYAFMPQLRNATGFGNPRTADAVAFSLYPSRGLTLHGFEIKVNRGDWLNELKRPEKAEEIQRFCHHWSIVAPPGVLDVGELPALWGFIEVKGRALRAVKAAPMLSPQPLTMEIIASMFRNFSKCAKELTADYVHRDEVEKAAEERAEQIASRRDPQHVRHRLDRLEEQVKQFEDASGIKITESWTAPEKVGKVVSLVLKHGSLEEEYRWAAERMRKLADSIEAELLIPSLSARRQ